jgi:hypothetical protein
MSKFNWRQEDGVALRQFFKIVPQEKLSSLMKDQCMAQITTELLIKGTAEGVARIAAMKAGWEAYEEALINLAAISPQTTPEASYKDMT